MGRKPLVTQPVKTQSDNRTVVPEPTNSEALYKRLVENAVDVIWSADLEGRFTYLSPQFKTLFGFDPATTIGHTNYDFVHPDDQQEIVNSAENLRNGFAPRNIEFRHRCSDGRYMWVMVKAALTYNAQGVAVGSQGIIRDINDRKIAQLELQEVQGRFRLITESVPSMIYRHVLRADGTDELLYAGPQCRDLFEVEPEEALKDINKLAERYYDSDFIKVKKLRDESAKNLSLFRSEYRVLLPQKGIRWRLSVSQPSKADNGDIFWDGIVTDITDSKNVELQLQKANEQLEKTTKMKDEFLATMSHELRTPLSAILSINEGLQREMYGPITGDQASSYKIIQESGHHLLDLINEVLDLAKIESGSLELVTSEIDIIHLCESCLQIVSPQAKEKNIKLRFQWSDRLNSLHADDKRVRQILVNLLNNAVKFTNAGGEVTLQVQSIITSDSIDGDFVRFSVTDNGIGIDDAKMSTLFEPFSQAQTALNREYEGIGLGLAIVKKITELLSGEVRVKSVVGSGTRFCVVLPFRKSKQPDTKPALSDTHKIQDDEDYKPNLYMHDREDSVVQVLLAEDNDAVALSTTRFLELSNCKVRRVSNGKDAVSDATTHTPDIILMDIQMPGVDGLECIKLIRQIAELQTIPIIAVTGLAMQDDSTRCLNAGANRYLSKPYRMQSLVKLMGQLLHPQPEQPHELNTQSQRQGLSA